MNRRAAMITDASGIGRATVRAFAAQKAKLFVRDINAKAYCRPRRLPDFGSGKPIPAQTSPSGGLSTSIFDSRPPWHYCSSLNGDHNDNRDHRNFTQGRS